MSTITSFCMFFLSFVPLWVSILFIDFMSLHQSQANPWTEIISISLITVVSLISIIVLLRVLCVPKGADCIADYKIVDVVTFLIFFSVFGFLSIRHNQFSVNILLELFGYRFYHCKLENDDNITIERMVVSRYNLRSPMIHMISARAINNEYLAVVSESIVNQLEDKTDIRKTREEKKIICFTYKRLHGQCMYGIRKRRF